MFVKYSFQYTQLFVLGLKIFGTQEYMTKEKRSIEYDMMYRDDAFSICFLLFDKNSMIKAVFFRICKGKLFIAR